MFTSVFEIVVVSVILISLVLCHEWLTWWSDEYFEKHYSSEKKGK